MGYGYEPVDKIAITQICNNPKLKKRCCVNVPRMLSIFSVVLLPFFGIYFSPNRWIVFCIIFLYFFVDGRRSLDKYRRFHKHQIHSHDNRSLIWINSWRFFLFFFCCSKSLIRSFLSLCKVVGCRWRCPNSKKRDTKLKPNRFVKLLLPLVVFDFFFFLPLTLSLSFFVRLNFHYT